MRYMFFIFFLATSWALPTDKQQPIHFSAGSIEWDHIQSHGVFKDNVCFQQGSTQLHATSGYSIGDAMHQFTKIVMHGTKNQPAHFITTPKINEPEINAFSDEMIYLPLQKLIILQGNVHVKQGRYEFYAPYVQYNTELKKLLTKPQQQQNTTIVINPE